MGIALEELRKMNLNLKGLEMAYDLYRKLADEMGMGRKGTQALYLALKK